MKHTVWPLYSKILPAILASISLILYRAVPLYPYDVIPLNLKEAELEFVIDGDTIEIAGDQRVRYIGIDSPEENEPLYAEAKELNKGLLKGRKIRLDICAEESHDKYGRLLAWVYADGELVNSLILKNGLADIMIISPCGLKHAGILRKSRLEAIDHGLGIWAGMETIDAQSAGRYIGKAARVHGQVVGVHDSGEAVFINFTPDIKKGFCAVILYNSLDKFKSSEVDPAELLNKKISVTGTITKHHGRPEIVVEDPSQIELNPRSPSSLQPSQALSAFPPLLSSPSLAHVRV